jgi:hypothetical protein
VGHAYGRENRNFTEICFRNLEFKTSLETEPEMGENFIN